jgi:hypothetical protein
LSALALLAVAVSTPDTRGSWSAQITNTADSVATATVAYTHTYTSGTCTSEPAGSVPYGTEITCPGSIAPLDPVPITGSVSTSDSIAYSGTVAADALRQDVRLESCGPVEHANRVTAANPMLARYDMAFATSGGPMDSVGYVMLDGDSPGAYASSIVQQSQPPPVLALGPIYGLGIWFKTASTAGGPLFGFGNSPINLAGSNDRILYLNASGQLAFRYNLGGTEIVSTSTYEDDQWHYAYVTLSAVRVVLVTIEQVTLYVDGIQVAQTPLLSLGGYSSYNGYWHLGWSPLTSLPDYFTGSLSNFVVLNTSPAPANMGAPATQAAFNTAVSSSVTEHWLLNDTGTTTYSGSLPVIGATDPCSMIDAVWELADPTSCAWSPQSLTNTCSTSSALSQMVTDGWRQVSAPAPATTQTGTLSCSRDLSYNALYLPGLRLYTPLLFRGVTVVGAWGNTFAWRSASSVVIG